MDKFVEELIEVRKRAFPDGKVEIPCVVEELGPLNCACVLHRGSPTFQAVASLSLPVKGEKRTIKSGKSISGA